MIISSISYKGGVGKSTIAQNLAVCLAHQGNKVCIVDADETGASTEWSGRRFDREITPAITVVSLSDPKSIIGNVKLLYKDYDVIVIDSPPSISRIASKIMLVSHLLIVPVIPKGGAEKDVTEKFLEQFTEVQERKENIIPAYILMNQYNNKYNLHRAFFDAMKEVAKEFEIEVLKTTFSERVAYGEANIIGLGVYEYSNQKAKKEVTQLVDEILKKLNN